ncbi:alpha/beta fold hydrolase [Rhodococcoides fascians]|uniref:alpha/beta fold hydrolase n=1 Tax=Rhodococcoides fascians TaxID=1828 RepID=UPI000568E57B|nr:MULTISPECIES: alpha/beta hydrolase [Rhodococcus]OZE91306.1 2-hydroxy-6-oxo-2,4-heptadienoate hydrolase [Rhodococcus sp. 15-1189-1-1a]OZF15594.1 2-hydroxy-6-oxo-2,4-heptadienoate hydrolase [Rhodococcus sp. 14-2686-1-2]
MTTATEQTPEIANTVDAGGIATNYHDEGTGAPVILIHGSGPGVTAWANWRGVIPELSKTFRVVAPDILGFGFTERPDGVQYGMEVWTRHLVDFLDALELDRVSIVGNSFGGALALSIATRHPERVDKLVLMGSVGVPFEITDGLDAVWGFEPSFENMRSLLDVFAYDRSLVNDELARLRLAAATRPGVQEAFSAMFPAPRQQGVDAMTVDQELVRELQNDTLIVHGRDDQVIPMSNSVELAGLIDKSQLHVFGRCGHWVQIEESARFNALVGSFLAE